MFIKEAETRSNGTLKFTHYPASQLYTDTQIVDVLPKGGVEMAKVNGLLIAGLVPEVSTAWIPGYYKDQDHYYRVMYDVDNGGGLSDKIIEPWFENKANIKLLGMQASGLNMSTLTTKPVMTLEDFKGLKVRSVGRPVSVFLESLGCAPVVMSSSEVYMGLQRNTINGTFYSFSAAADKKLYEVAKYAQDYYTGPSNFVLCANLDFWKKLTVTQKRAIIEASSVAELWSIQAAMDDDLSVRKKLQDGGVEIYKFSASDQQKMYELARPGLIKMMGDDLGEELANSVIQIMEGPRDTGTTWQDSCKQHTQRLLDALK